MTGAVAVLDLLRAMQRSVAAFALCLPCALTPAWAGFVTTNQSGLEQIFSQSAFGTTPIDIRFNRVVTIGRPDLLNIDSERRLSELFHLGDSENSTTIDIFYVDTIDECGEFAKPIVGCGDQPGNKLMVESSFAANAALGAALIAHELGHNLGLPHLGPPPTNLMNPALTGNKVLTTGQASIIRNSPLVQVDNNAQLFIQITPFAIVVPEPQTMLFVLAGGAWVLQRARRRRAA